MNICVIGAGNWGKNHIDTLSSLDALAGVVEIDKRKINNLKKTYPDIKYFDSLDKAIGMNFDGYIVCTPSSTHASIAKVIINNNKPVLVEKPLALSLNEGEELEKMVNKKNGKLLVGHLLLFHPAILKMKEMIDNDKIGDIQYIYSNRLSLGVVRKSENVFWSFAPHDISLFQFFSDSFPIEVLTKGSSFLQKSIHDFSLTNFKYPNNINAHIFVSWLHPFKEHRFVIIGSKGMLHFEDSHKDKPLLFYNMESLNKKNKISLKNIIPEQINYNSELPLLNEQKYFIEIINGKRIERVGINQAMDVLKILDMGT